MMREPKIAASDLRMIADKLIELAASVEGPVALSLANLSEGEELAALARVAAAEYKTRRQREKHLPGNLFREPGWNMLLELFRLNGQPLRTTSLCLASGSPTTTALRWLGVLEDLGLIERSDEVGDNRATLVKLTDHGRSTMRSILREEVIQYYEVSRFFQSPHKPDESYVIGNKSADL